MEFIKAKEIISGSKSFTFEGTVLTIQGYFTGGVVRLDLGKLTPEMLEELSPVTYEIRPDYDEHVYEVVEVDVEGNTVHLVDEFEHFDDAVAFCEDAGVEWYEG